MEDHLNGGNGALFGIGVALVIAATVVISIATFGTGAAFASMAGAIAISAAKGALIGAAIGSALGIAGGAIIGAVVGGVIGGLQFAGHIATKVPINSPVNNPLDEFVTIGPKAGQISQYIQSISQTGNYGQIFVTRLANGMFQIANGHHRVAALIALGYEFVKVFIMR